MRMRLMTKLCRFRLLLAGGLAAFSAAAQQEQWLEYHTSSEPRGYRWFELSTNVPAGVALPKLQPNAQFGCWSNGLETASGRWFCLDRASRFGPFNTLYFDCNGNGRLDDEKPISVRRRDSGSMVYFEPVKVVFKGEDGPISYHLLVQLYQYGGDRVQMMLGSGGWYEGQVNFAGKKHRVQLFDNNVNGTFNDQGLEPSECDRLVVVDGKNSTLCLGKYLEIDEQLLQVEVARDGAFIKTQKAEGVKFGSVRVPETISDFEAVGPAGDFWRKPAKGEFTLPLGKYRVNSWTVNRKDEKGATWTLSGYGFGRTANFEVTEGTTVALNIGEPIRLVLQASESKSAVSFNLKTLGQLGESVQVMRGNTRPRAPQLHVASLTGSFRSTNTFEYG